VWQAAMMTTKLGREVLLLHRSVPVVRKPLVLDVLIPVAARVHAVCSQPVGPMSDGAAVLAKADACDGSADLRWVDGPRSGSPFTHAALIAKTEAVDEVADRLRDEIAIALCAHVDGPRAGSPFTHQDLIAKTEAVDELADRLRDEIALACCARVDGPRAGSPFTRADAALMAKTEAVDDVADRLRDEIAIALCAGVDGPRAGSPFTDADNGDEDAYQDWLDDQQWGLMEEFASDGDA